jgi:ankyrin repeat protein
MGDTALHGAAKNGHAETCKLLIAAGAELNAQNKVSYFEVQVVEVVKVLRLKTLLLVQLQF